MCTVAQALSTVPLLRTELSPKYWFTSTRDQVHLVFLERSAPSAKKNAPQLHRRRPGRVRWRVRLLQGRFDPEPARRSARRRCLRRGGIHHPKGRRLQWTCARRSGWLGSDSRHGLARPPLGQVHAGGRGRDNRARRGSLQFQEGERLDVSANWSESVPMLVGPVAGHFSLLPVVHNTSVSNEYNFSQAARRGPATGHSSHSAAVLTLCDAVQRRSSVAFALSSGARTRDRSDRKPSRYALT